MSNKNINDLLKTVPPEDVDLIIRNYGDVFKKVRQSKYPNQKLVAEFFDISQPFISLIEGGQKLPTDELDSLISSVWGISVKSVIENFINQDELPAEIQQTINLLKNNSHLVSPTAMALLLADAKHIIERDLGGAFHEIQKPNVNELSINWRAYGWSFILRKLMEYIKLEINGVISYDRMVCTRRHPNMDTFSESLVISRHMVWWNHWDNKKAVNRTAGIHGEEFMEVFNDQDPMADSDLFLTDRDGEIYTNYKTSLWFPITNTPNEEALLIFTRSKNHKDGNFTVADYEYIQNAVTAWIPENVVG